MSTDIILKLAACAILCALYLLGAWLLGPETFSVFWRRLALVVGLFVAAYFVVPLLPLSPPPLVGSIAAVIVMLATAGFLAQPIKWGIDDYWVPEDPKP